MAKVAADQAQDFLRKSSLGLAIVCLVIISPFALNNFLQGRYLLGLGTLVILTFFAFNTWTILRHQRYYDMLTLVGLVPAILMFLVFALFRQGIIGMLWCYPAAISFYFMLPERKAWIANIVLLAVTLPVAWVVVEQTLAVRMVATLTMVSIFSAIFIRAINEQQDKLRAQAVTDPLTGVLNRTLLHETLEQAIEQNHRAGVPMTLVAIDIDHFKSINDTYGHDVGDQVLRGIGQLLQDRIRIVDSVFRLGGEEFLLLFYGVDADNSCQIAEELCQTIGAQELLPDRSVTVSLGVATLQPEEDRIGWMKRGDKNLYRAKARGRNCVMA